MMETFKVIFYAFKLGIRTGYHVFCDELLKYKSFKEMQKRRVF